MSVKGLNESERIAAGITRNVNASLRKQLQELKAELAKVEFLLSDRDAARAWANSPADAARIAQLVSQMDEVEQLYLTAGDTTAARIFKSRMQRSLRARLTNIKANELEVKMRIAKSKAKMQDQLTTGLTEVRREGALGEMYSQARGNGGFFANFGRPYLQDLVTLETKAAGSKTLGEYMTKLYTQYEASLKDVFCHGIIRGDSYKQMEEALVRATDITAGKAKLLVRTESNAIFNESVREVIDDNPLVKGYRFRAVLDSKTSKICQQHDGEYIPKEDVKPGVNYPPLHPNCRSTVTTVLVDEDERADTVQRYTKNGRNQWEKVPPGMTYQEYKDKFGFSNSKNPRTYNASTRDIHDASLARLTVTQYKGYVKPSASSTARIQKMVKAYVDGDKDYLEAVKQNTRQQEIRKAMLRQAQAESGFDGLPLELAGSSFDREVDKNGYRVLYRQFGKEEDLDSFLHGDQMYGSGQSNYGAGTYTFESAPQDNAYGPRTVKMALKSPESKILKIGGSTLDSQFDIGAARTPDERINAVLRQVSGADRKDLISILATEYGYDAIEVTSQTRGKYMLILNRTAVVVKGD